jgi:hypothetical protein
MRTEGHGKENHCDVRGSRVHCAVVIEIADDANYTEDLDLRSCPARKIRAAKGQHPVINGNIILGNKCVLEGLAVEPLEYEFWGREVSRSLQIRLRADRKADHRG